VMGESEGILSLIGRAGSLSTDEVMVVCFAEVAG